MPAVTVLPLGSTAVTYKDIAAASTPSKSTQTARSQAPLPSSIGEVSSGSTKSSDSPNMESTGGTKEQDSSNRKPPNEPVKNHESINPADKVNSVEKSKGNGAGKDGNSTTGTASPSQSSNSIPQMIPSHGTPQQGGGYYVAYNNSQVTPEPPSPHTSGPTVYDMGSFFQQPSGFHSSPFAAMPAHPYAGAATGQSQPPNSPNSQSIPPASPLFPRATNPSTAALLGASRGELSPGPPYVSSAGSTEDFSAWGDSRAMQSSYPPSPQISAQGIPIPYVPGMPLPRSTSDRSASFDESMLPPTIDSAGIGSGPTAGAAAAGPVPGTLFAHQQPWGYGGPDMYGASSPLQPRPTVYAGQMGGHHPHSRHPPPPHIPPYGGQYYPAASPGPPIQTTSSNKGPDGANLFIFHIPNHFTNVDMYQLFYPYGNLLSVRIMVEKDTGRSRGFGFVSYDSPDAAALAIKELNGYAIGNKRLKVQHKQIRPSEQQQYDRGYGGGAAHQDSGHYSSHHVGGVGYGAGRGMNLPPSGPMAAAAAGWHNQRNSGSGVSNVGVMAPQNISVGGDGGGIVGGGPGMDQTYGGEDPAVSHATTNEPPSSGQDGAERADPLSTMEPLRQSLPDAGNDAGTSNVEGEI